MPLITNHDKDFDNDCGDYNTTKTVVEETKLTTPSLQNKKQFNERQQQFTFLWQQKLAITQNPKHWFVFSTELTKKCFWQG